MENIPKFMIEDDGYIKCPCGCEISTREIDRVHIHISWMPPKGYCNNGINFIDDKFVCICGGKFNTFEETKEHIRLKNRKCMNRYLEKEETTCKICNLTFEYKCHRIKHEKTKTHIEKATGEYKNISLHCKVCDIKCLSKALMEVHLKTKKHMAKIDGSHLDLECKICNIKCSNQTQMKIHLETKKHKELEQNGDQHLDLECKTCNIKCRGQKEMKTHLQTKKHLKRVTHISQ